MFYVQSIAVQLNLKISDKLFEDFDFLAIFSKGVGVLELVVLEAAVRALEGHEDHLPEEGDVGEEEPGLSVLEALGAKTLHSDR